MAADPVTDPAADLYRKANENFVSEDYDRALELYSSALLQDPTIVECYAAKAQTYIKTERFELAKKEADRGVDILRGLGDSDDRVKTETRKCFQRSGTASFQLGHYREAKNSFAEAAKLDPADKGLSQWIAWCEEKIKKFGDTHTSKQQQPSDKKQQPEAAPSEGKSCTATTNTPPAAPEAAPTQPTSTTNEMPVPKIKHDWYQTETQVIVEVRIKKLKEDEVQVDIQPTSLSVTAKLAQGSEYSLELDLAHPVVPEQSSYRVLSTKLEIKLRKEEGVRWSTLEGEGVAPIPGATPAPSKGAAVKAPYASGRDWNAMEKMLAAEAEEKKEGEAALNEMFQKIYADANDEVKKAMNKSFQESGGTVLSTNWAEIGKEKVEVKPPDGMEYKKWD